jgi:hypothetical protein
MQSLLFDGTNENQKMQWITGYHLASFALSSWLTPGAYSVEIFATCNNYRSQILFDAWILAACWHINDRLRRR